jgi:DNA uptake protein ComE-like DNA-binding protein
MHGMALLTAIWILALLLVMVAGFAAMVHSELEVARNFGDLTKARWAARAGFYRAQVEVEQRAASTYTTLDGGSQLGISAADESVTLGDGVTYQTVIEDEAGKVNINTASSTVLSTLFSEEVADAIIDWRDTDSTPQPNGAEDDYYIGLATPYHCKNAPFTTVDELLLVKGITRDMLDAVVTEDGLKLRELLTVASTDTNTDADGQARVNIATATKDQLTSALGSVFTSREFDAIIKQRTSSAFTSPADLLKVPNLAREKVMAAFDKLTTTQDKARPGLVNINTAPAEVLAALPGMDAATAQAVVQERTDNGAFTDVGQLLRMDQVSNELFMGIANLLTARSKIFRVVAAGQCKDGMSQSITCVLQADAAGGQSSQILYWQE